MCAHEEQPVQVTPDDVVLDYLIGEHELEKLKNGFQAPVTECVSAEASYSETPSSESTSSEIH